MAEGQAAYDSVFRRADPARQGRIAPDAFAEYFGDGVSSRREMDDLFSIVDEDGDGWIEPDELQPFLMGGGGVVHELFCQLGAMNGVASSCVDDMRRNYRRSGRVGQFRTRLGLREAARQLQALSAALLETHDQMTDDSARDSRHKDAARQLAREYVGDSGRSRGGGASRAGEGEGSVSAELQQVRNELALLRREVRSLPRGERPPAVAGGEDEDEGDEGDEEDEEAANEHVNRARAPKAPAADETLGLGEDYGEDFGDEGDVDEEEANTADGPTLLAVIAQASRRGDLPQRGRGYLKQALLTERLSDRAQRALIRYAKTGDRDALIDAMTM